MKRPDRGTRFTVTAKVLLALCVAAALTTIGVIGYATATETTKARGSGGLVTRNSPDRSPPPPAMLEPPRGH